MRRMESQKAARVRQIRDIYDGRVIHVSVASVQLPNGHNTELEIVRVPDGAAAVAIDAQGRICLLRQYRYVAQGWIWELPAGKVEPGEPPLETARRELVEEAGCAAARWRALGPVVSSPGVFSETVHLYLASELDSVKMAHEAAELIEVHWIALQQACSWALSGEIRDGKTIVGLLRARGVLEDAPEDHEQARSSD